MDDDFWLPGSCPKHRRRAPGTTCRSRCPRFRAPSWRFVPGVRARDGGSAVARCAGPARAREGPARSLKTGDGVRRARGRRHGSNSQRLRCWRNDYCELGKLYRVLSSPRHAAPRWCRGAGEPFSYLEDTGPRSRHEAQSEPQDSNQIQPLTPAPPPPPLEAAPTEAACPELPMFEQIRICQKRVV